MSQGVILDADDLTVLDTRAVPWEPSDYRPGALAKTLARDEQGDGTIMFRCMGRMNQALRDTPSRGRHLYRQTSLVLGGQDPQWEFETDVWEVDPAAYKIFMRGVYSDRLSPADHGGCFPRLPVTTLSCLTLFTHYEEGAPDAFLGTKEERRADGVALGARRDGR